MARDGTATKEKILDAGQQLLLKQGYGGTSVDQVIEEAGITKGAFFYHFKSKNDLANAMMDRFVKMDDELLHELMDRVEKLSHDPLQQYLIFVGLFEERIRNMDQPHPGCLIASYIYQIEAFSPETRQAVIDGFDEWRRVLVGKLEEAIKKQKPKLPVTASQIYDNLLSQFEGGVILGKLYNNTESLIDQINQHKNYVELLFGVHD